MVQSGGGLGGFRKEKNKMQYCIKCQTYIKCTCALGNEVSVLFYIEMVMIWGLFGVLAFQGTTKMQ